MTVRALSVRLADELATYTCIETLLVAARKDDDGEKTEGLARRWVACSVRINSVRRQLEQRILVEQGNA